MTEEMRPLAAISWIATAILAAFMCFTQLGMMLSLLAGRFGIAAAAPVALVLALLLGDRLARRVGLTGRARLWPAGLALGVLAGSLAISAWYFDLSWDGEWYHQTAIYAIARDWNPLTDPTRYVSPAPPALGAALRQRAVVCGGGYLPDDRERRGGQVHGAARVGGDGPGRVRRRARLRLAEEARRGARPRDCAKSRCDERTHHLPGRRRHDWVPGSGGGGDLQRIPPVASGRSLGWGPGGNCQYQRQVHWSDLPLLRLCGRLALVCHLPPRVVVTLYRVDGACAAPGARWHSATTPT